MRGLAVRIACGVLAALTSNSLVAQRTEGAEPPLVRLGPPVPAPVAAAQREQEPSLESEIERMLQEAEAQRQQAGAAPELGAGLGARFSAFNPNITVIGDFVGHLSTAPDADGREPILHADLSENDADDIRVRGIEIRTTAAVDPYADALLKLHFGGAEVELEEAYLLVHDFSFSPWLKRLLGDGVLKIGRFRMALGATNLTDDHDLPTVDRALVLQQFLGEEGLKRLGVSYNRRWHSAGPWVKELTVEFTNGQSVAEPGEEPVPVRGTDFPLGLVRYQWYREWPAKTPPAWNPAACLGPGEQTLTIGLTGLATAEERPRGSTYALLQAVDVMWTWVDERADIYREWLLQGELYVAETEHPAGGARGDVGGYLLVQRRLARPWYVGARLDATELPRSDGYLLGASVYATYFLTEFNRFRVQYQWLRQDLQEGPDITAHTVWFQTVYAFGAHPEEPYYIRQRF